MNDEQRRRYPTIPTQRFIFNYANVTKGGEYHQFNINQSGVIPVPTTNEINLSEQNRTLLFSSNYDAGFDNVFDWYTVFNGNISVASRNTVLSNGGDTIGPVDIPSSTLPISVDANRGVEDVYKIFSNNNLKIPGSGITYIEKRELFQPFTLSTPNTNTSFVINTWKAGVPTAVNIADWNIDNFGFGTKNPSGITLDFTKIQTLVIEINSRGRGSIRVGFLIGNIYYFGHEIKTNNLETEIPFGNLNLPILQQARKSGANEITRDVGFFDGNTGVSFSAITDTSSEPSAIYSYNSYSAVAYNVGATISELKRPFVVDMGQNYVTADVLGVLLFAVRPKSQLSGVNNKTVYSVDHFNVSTRTPNLDDEVLVDLWWNITGADSGTWQDLDYYSGLEINFSSVGFNFTFGIRLGSVRVKGSTSKTFSIKDILNDYQNSFSRKQATFNGSPVIQEVRGTMALVVRSMPGNSGVDPVLVSASLTGGEVA